MRVDLPFQLGSVPIEWILAGLPVLALSMILLALLGGGSAEKQTRRRIERIRASNAPTLTPQQMVSIRLSDNDSGIVLLDGLIKHLVPRPDLQIGRTSCRERGCQYV